MSDIVSKKKRSEMMAGIKSRNTKPELLVRSILHKRGFRFRLHVRNLPGKPDMVLAKYKAVIFIHGCFWHGHNCSLFKMPASNESFWNEKISGNRQRDFNDGIKLKEMGWRVLIIWECAFRGKGKVNIEETFTIITSWLKMDTNEDLEIRGI